MLKLRTIQANYGDCFLLGYGSSTNPKYMLIDGGPQDTYERDLRGELERLSGDGIQKLDYVVLSHVDGDHIIGLLDFLTDNADRLANGKDPLLRVDNLWFNSFANAIDRGSGIQTRLQQLSTRANSMASPHTATELASIGDGNSLRIKAIQAGIPINQGFPNALVCVDDAPNPLTLENLSVTVVGPTRKNLDELQAEWEDWLDRFEPAFASQDLRLMANADQSKPNLSSIMIHVRAEGRTILFTGDGRSDHLLEGLDDAGLLDTNGNLHVDVLKVAHHGSNRNATKTFHKKVTADTYVISANGHPDNPDLSTLIWIVETAHLVSRQIEIRVTNETKSVRKLLSEYPESEFGYSLAVMPSHWHYWDLGLA